MEKFHYIGFKCLVLAPLIAIVFLLPSPLRGEGKDENPPAACSDDDDCDGVLNNDEQRLGTKPDVCDTDGDGLSDGVELGRIQPKELGGCHGLAAAGTNYKRPHEMDPLNPDSDGDGLTDGAEDANGNGWNDPNETDPSIEDSDNDGQSDYVEATGDFDGDKLADFDLDIVKGGAKCTPPEAISDLDCDEIPNARDEDSDNDGCPDRIEGGWIDANTNGIPDIYDNQTKTCPEPAAPAPSIGGGKPPDEKEGGEGTEELNIPTLSDGQDGAACALSPSPLPSPLRGEGRRSGSIIWILLACLVIIVKKKLSLVNRPKFR